MSSRFLQPFRLLPLPPRTSPRSQLSSCSARPSTEGREFQRYARTAEQRWDQIRYELTDPAETSTCLCDAEECSERGEHGAIGADQINALLAAERRVPGASDDAAIGGVTDGMHDRR